MKNCIVHTKYIKIYYCCIHIYFCDSDSLTHISIIILNFNYVIFNRKYAKRVIHDIQNNILNVINQRFSSF